MQSIVEPIKSVCPKCGKEGTQSITYKPSKENPKTQYLTMIHGKDERHYIGRIRRPGEGLGLLNRPQSNEEYENALKDISKQLRDLADYYSNSKSGSAVKLARAIQDILMGYGY